jgi:hypothetical protein
MGRQALECRLHSAFGLGWVGSQVPAVIPVQATRSGLVGSPIFLRSLVVARSPAPVLERSPGSVGILALAGSPVLVGNPVLQRSPGLVGTLALARSLGLVGTLVLARRLVPRGTRLVPTGTLV